MSPTQDLGPSALNSIAAAQGSNPTAMQAPVTPQAPAQGGSWLSRLLPTVGAIGGGLLGTLADPIVGPAGTIAGGAIGSALGQQGENDLTGSKGSTLTSGIEGGAAQLLGLGIGKGIEGAAGALGGVADKQAANVADATENAAWKGIEGSAAAKNANLGPTLEKMKAYGIDTSSPESLGEVTGKVTGPEGAVASDLVRSAMTNSTNPVDITGVRTIADNMAESPELHAEGPTVGKAFANTVNSILGLDKTGASLTNQSAGDVYAARQLLMNKAYGKGVPDALSSAYHDLADSLDGALTRSGVDEVAVQQGMTPEQFQQLHDISPDLANEVAAASQQNIGALRSVQKPFVDASNLSKAATYHAGGQLQSTLEAKTAKAIADASKSGMGADLQAAADKVHPTVGMLGRLVGLASKGAKPLSAIADKVPAVPVGTVLGQLGTHAAGLAAPPVGGSMTPGASAMSPYQTTGTADPNLMQQITQAGILDPAAVPALQGSLKAEQAQPLLQGLEQQYGAAGGAQGGGGGLLSQLSSYIPGTAAYQYHQEMGALASAISQATGASPQSILAVLPSLMANQTGAQNAFGELQGSLNTAVPNAGLQGNFGSVSATPQPAVLNGL